MGVGWVMGNKQLFKVGLSSSKKLLFICFNDSPSKMIKNTLYFILKALFILKIFSRRNSMVNNESQHTYLSISHELKGTRQ